METKKIAVLVGSLRRESFSRKIAKVLISLAPKTLALELVEIGQLPLYNEDLEQHLPDSWREFREHIRGYDGVLFVTPEYNRSVPGLLKNALDVGSRPKEQSVWNGKPAVVVSVSPGAISAFGANHHLRQSLVYLNMPTMAQPEAYIGRVKELLDADGKLVNDSTKAFLSDFMLKFADWVDRNTASKEAEKESLYARSFDL